LERDELTGLLIDILIGRSFQDIQLLLLKYREQTYGRSLLADINNGVRNQELRYALSVSLQHIRDSLVPINQMLIQRDVSDITTLLRSSDATAIFNIFLRRTDPHILAIGMSYGMGNLDRDIDKSNSLSNTAKKVLLHALRTAYNIPYRDAVLLNESMGGSSTFRVGNDDKLSIRACRMHWARDTWNCTKLEYANITGKDFARKMGRRSGTFGALMGALASL